MPAAGERDDGSKQVGRTKVAVIAAAALLVIGAGLSGILLVPERPHVKWSSVLARARSRQTIHGWGKIYAADGDWAHTFWGTTGPDGDYTSRGMVTALPGASEERLPRLRRLLGALDYCGDDGFMVGLGKQSLGRSPAAKGTWGGAPALVVEFRSRRARQNDELECPDLCAVFLDRKSGLPLALELLDLIAGDRRVLAWCEYEYDRPLPRGFGEAPG